MRKAERYLLLAGVALLAVYGVARLAENIASRDALRNFDAIKQAARAEPPEKTVGGRGAGVDVTLWSQQRIRAYETSLEANFGSPIAVLSIPKLKLRVPVFNGTDSLTLDRGVGWIVGTSKPGELGNIGIAGHRDGFFRGLKDVISGDEIDLETIHGTERYFVGNEQIVQPEDVSVLAPRSIPTLTLVTCYPFYYVGSAPQRYIVTAFGRRERGTLRGQVHTVSEER